MLNKDYMKTKEYRQKMSKIMKGRILTREHKKRISESRIKGLKEGRILPWNKGIPCSEERKRNISFANSGKFIGEHHSPKTEFRKGNPSWNKNKKMDDMFRLKVSNSKKKLNINKKEIIEMYINQELSTRDIAKKFNCSRIAIRYLLRNEGIKLRNKATITQYKKVSLKLREIPKSLDARKKMSVKKQGISLEQWNGFKGSEKYSNNWVSSFKNSIRKRDNQICMNCGIHREKLKESLHIHHVNYDKKLSIPENCICLCRKCHLLTNINRKYWESLFQEKLSKLYNYKYSEDSKIILNLNKEKEIYSEVKNANTL